jgi:hypothetical protein
MFPNKCVEKLIRRVVRIQVAQSIWDHQVLPNRGVFTIYLKLVPTFENRDGRFDEC